MARRPGWEDTGRDVTGGPMAMEFHLFLPQMRLTPDALTRRAQAAETAGFDGLALMDHLAPPGAPDQPMFEAVTAATWLLAVTERLRLGHLVLCDTFRHPAVLARQAVTLDHLSGGRFELGIGTGSMPTEMAAFGFGAPPAADRAARLGETLELLHRFWTGEPVHYQGSYFQVEGVRQLPVPLGRLPVVIGGTGPATMALVDGYADWWNVPVHQLGRWAGSAAAAGRARVSVQVLVTLITEEGQRDRVVEQAARRFGRMGERGHLVGSPSELVPQLVALREDGAERVYTWFTDFAAPDSLAVFGREVIDALR
jgi:alkanesulfonate monooxygenase SsuD/methylene tetrahydromethanopterin reductase-like flavin-dependent oxidoreductase (luciferase family)